VEFLGACASAYDQFANVVSTAALNVIKDQWFVYPGRIFPGAVATYYPDFTMKHLLFVPPFLWDELVQTQEFPDKTVAWLLAVPISENEMRYASTNGPDALEELFEQEQIDAFDLERPSVA
jgi:antitoxin YqcF